MATKQKIPKVYVHPELILERGPSDGRPTYWKSVLALVGHLIGTAVIFVSFILLGWVIGFILHGLNQIHPISDDVMKVIIQIELGFIYADAVLCSFVLFFAFFDSAKISWELGDEK
jgi:hypothetical protein